MHEIFQKSAESKNAFLSLLEYRLYLSVLKGTPRHIFQKVIKAHNASKSTNINISKLFRNDEMTK